MEIKASKLLPQNISPSLVKYLKVERVQEKHQKVYRNLYQKNIDFCTSFAKNRKWQISIPIEPARSELISAGVRPSQATRELRLEIEAKIEKKSLAESSRKATENHPESQENNTDGLWRHDGFI